MLISRELGKSKNKQNIQVFKFIFDSMIKSQICIKFNNCTIGKKMLNYNIICNEYVSSSF